MEFETPTTSDTFLAMLQGPQAKAVPMETLKSSWTNLDAIEGRIEKLLVLTSGKRKDNLCSAMTMISAAKEYINFAAEAV